jgi:predicted HicB family RNase H-like nuclease
LAQGAEATAGEVWVENRNGGDPEIQISEMQTGVDGELGAERLKRITFEVPEKQHQRVKVYAAGKGISIKELMMELLERELSRG